MAEQRISWFNERNTEASLNLNPQYQRNPVWSSKNKKFLIDTILRNLPIPEIYMQVKTNPLGKSEYIVVDGQQRIRAILEFISGEYELDGTDNPQYADKYFQDLPSGVQQEFWAYKIPVREIETNSDEHIRGIFQRMNKNVVPLNAQELRNATYIGHFIILMKQLADDQEFFSQEGILTAPDIKRMKDVEYISELFFVMMRGIEQFKNELLDSHYMLYDEHWQDKEKWKGEYQKTIAIISEIFDTLKGSRWRYKSDFYSLFCAVYQLNQEYIFPAEKYEHIKKSLNDFSDKVTTEQNKSKTAPVNDYWDAVTAHSNNKNQREKRNRILRSLIIPFLISRDKKRNFTEEERMIIWAKSNRKCVLCSKEVIWDDYEADHKDAHSKGGKTILENGQVTHKTCNASKGNR